MCNTLRIGEMGNDMSRLVGWIDLVLFLALIAFGLWVVVCQPWKLDGAAAASLAGAVFGGAALLLGNWINRSSDRHKSEHEQLQRVEKIKALIAAELVDVAIGLMDAKKLMDAAIVSLNAGGPVATTLDMSRYRPRTMSFTDGLGAELLALEKASIDALTTLRSNLAVTRQAMDEITDGANFGLLKATSLSNGLGHDMTVLSETFGHIAPDRKLQLPGKDPEPIRAILVTAAKPPADPPQAPGA